MSALARWDAFLSQIEHRHAAVRTEAEASARAFIASVAAGGDHQPLSHHWMAITNRLQDLEAKIIDTWHAQVEDAIFAEGHDTAERDRQYARGLALQHRLDDARCELEPRIFAELARARWHHGQYESAAAIGAHAIAQEAAVAAWRAMRQAERAMHAQRPPYSLESLKHYERAQIAYWFHYLSVRAQFEPILARDPAREVRDRMQQWYELFADHEPAWRAAGDPRERI